MGLLRRMGLAAVLCAAWAAQAQESTPGGQLHSTPRCGLEFLPNAELTRREPASLPRAGGAMHSEAEVRVWAARAQGRGPDTGDALQPVDRAEWARLKANAARLLAGGEPAIPALDADRLRWTHGTLARDAAFIHRLAGDDKLLVAVRAHLRAQVANPFNDLAALCVRPLTGPVRDAWFGEAGWLLRHAVTYDYVRADMPTEERVAAENWLRRNAYALAAQLDWGLAQVLPGRSAGDASRRSGAAAAAGDARWTARRYDTNGDCRIDGEDDPREFQVRAYARADGSTGPRLSVLSQYFNNRRAVSAVAAGVVGVLLDDASLQLRARRYFGEWLAYSVWPDGSEGEFSRNGDYCIPAQGLIYGATNSQAMILMAWAQARQGDRSLFDLSTRDGLFGSESGTADAPKSLALVTSTLLRLRSGELEWFMHEPWRERQLPRAETSLGATRSRFMGAGAEVDNFHELGLWLADPYLAPPSRGPRVGRAMRDRVRSWGAAASAPRTITGMGEHTDVLNALPSLPLLRP